MSEFQLLSMPLIGAAIGWLTNRLAVRLMFRPHRPVGLVGYTIQGVIPKRRADLARSIGQVVERDLISVEDLIGALRSGESMERISAAAAVSVKARIMDRLPAFVPFSVKRAVSDVITEQVRREIPLVTGAMIDRLSSDIKIRINFQSMVEDKISRFSPDRIERMVLSVAARELRHIEVLGGVLGFLIGLAQAGLLYLYR